MVGRGRLPASPVTLRRRRFFLIAAAISIGVHVLAALVLLFLPRLLPQEAKPQAQGTVELLMVEQKGDQPTQAGKPDDPKPAPPRPAAQQQTEPQKEEKPALAPPAPPAQAVAKGDEPAPPEQAPPQPSEAEVKPAPQPVQVPPAPPQPKQAPVFNLAGTESESNATALGPNIIPAMRDDRYRNRPPAYPVEAQMNHQHGAVVVLIHVAPNGSAASVEVLESSGYRLLDEAAVEAVRKWRFRPAIEHGQPVAFDMPFQFMFEP